MAFFYILTDSVPASERSTREPCVHSERSKARLRTTIERSSGPLYSVFVFLAGHFLRPLAREQGSDKRGHGVLAVHRLLGCVECTIDHVFSAGFRDARKALETCTGEPLGDKTYYQPGHVSMRSKVGSDQSRSLRTCREDVDKETAGNDGILNNLVGLAGELHILCPE